LRHILGIFLIELTKTEKRRAGEMNGQAKYLSGKNLSEVKSAIDLFLSASQPAKEPRLIEQGYRGFNIVQFGDRYYGVACDGRPFDPKRI
jgi:hypothetical protein